jgi:small subunit ribosomal protein S17
MSEAQTKGHSLTGTVVSNKMDKTISVRVDRLVAHPLYGKYVKRSTKVLAHDENNSSKIGDVVTVTSCKPLSSRKVWKLEKILSEAK